ncbi:MAG: FAD-dependent oxidoreductase [Firmicutes bacterium]|nr:FAD-dependent oxidoreductase [Bacillota bacterium]
MIKILIVGGVAGGATAAARLRRLDEHSEIILFEKGEHISFANCGLPYYIGKTIERRKNLLLQTPPGFSTRYKVDVRVRHEVLALDCSTKVVSVKNWQSGEIYNEKYDKLILSPGALPFKPPIEGMDDERVFTLRNMTDADIIKDYFQKNSPKSAVIVGGGFIGVEMAENLREAGLEVSIIEQANQLLMPLDIEMANEVKKHMQNKKITIYLKNGLNKIIPQEDGLLIEQIKGTLKADMLILAIGVKPDTAFIKAAGLSLNERGAIIVDSHMRTSDSDIYAVGDAVEIKDFISNQAAMIPLAGPANKQARIAADNICDIPSEYRGAQGSSIIKVFDLTVAASGVNEKTAQRIKLNYDKIYLQAPSHASYYPNAKPLLMKVIFDKNQGKLLGAQIVGYDGVDKRCDILAAFMCAGLSAANLCEVDLCYAPPYSSAKDPVNIAGYMIENILKGQVKNFHWHEVDDLPRDGSISLVDVRKPQEFLQGSIEGFINIPLDSLRERLEELDKAKPLYVNCLSGARSYVAARILTQNGFNVYNLSGGYRLYQAMQGEFVKEY